MAIFHLRGDSCYAPGPRNPFEGGPCPSSTRPHRPCRPPSPSTASAASTTRSRTPVIALAGVDLEVAPGEFFGLLGPNGAGKTTLIKILTTLLLPTSGEARIFGFDVATDTRRIRRIMNMVAGGEQSGYGILTVREQLWMFSQFYGLPSKEGWTRVDELIEAVGLERAAAPARQHAVHRPAPEDELRPRPAQRPVDPVPRRADAGPRRRRRALDPRARPRLEGRRPGPHGPAHHPLHGRGRRAVRADRDRRPRPDPGHRHARRAEAAGPAGVDLPARARPPRRRARAAGQAARRRVRGARRRQRHGGSPAGRGQPRPRGRRARSAASYRARRHRGRTSSRCASRSRRSRTCSSSSSGAASATRPTPRPRDGNDGDDRDAGPHTIDDPDIGTRRPRAAEVA